MMDTNKFQNFKDDAAVVKSSDTSVTPDVFEKRKDSNGVDTAYKKASDLVSQALNSGIVQTVKSNEVVQERILDTADVVIDSQLNAVKNNAIAEDKKSFFELNKDACSYFGYDEKTTGKSHIKLMTLWAWVFNTIYICTIGFFIVAPISFFFHKVSVVVKRQWVVLVLAFVIYALIVLTPFIVVWLGRI